MKTQEREKTDAAQPAESFLSKHPALIFLTIALTVFAAEAFVMLLFHYLPQQSFWSEAILDATLLVVLISPALYFFLFRPMVAHIRERRKIEETLRKNEEEKFKIMIHTSLDGFGVTDVRGRFLEVNDAYVHMMGYSRAELLNLEVSAIEAAETPQDTARYIGKLLETGRDRFETRQRRKDGRILDMEVNANYSKLHGGRIYCFLRDITERKQGEEKLRMSKTCLQATIDNSPYMIWQKDLDGRYIACNQIFAKASGQEQPQDVLGKTDLDLWPEGLAKKYRDDDNEVLSTRRQKVLEELTITDGQEYWVETCKTPIVDKNGYLFGTTGFAQDITVSKLFEGQMHHLAHYDALTGLPNKRLFSDRLQQALAIAKRCETHIALMFLDLDKFKPVNDELGHDVGDLLLKDVAKRLQNCVRESDTVSRIGGDEFVVLLPAIEAAQDAMLVADKILYALNQPFELADHSIGISASIGVAAYPEHGSDEAMLTKNADLAMYTAKNGGRNCARLYQPDMVGGVSDMVYFGVQAAASSGVTRVVRKLAA